MKNNKNRLGELLGRLALLSPIFVTLLLLSLTTNANAATTVDGTFRLRALKPQLDQQLRAKYITDSSYRRSIKESSRVKNMVVGESQIGFQVYNFAANVYEYRLGRLVATGKHCYVFAEHSASASLDQSADTFLQVAENFDNRVFPTVTSWFGRPQIPAAFSLADDRVYIFLLDIRDNFSEGYVAGYFDHRDLEGLFGNQKPVFFMDINPGEPGNPDDKNNSFYRTLAHEFQHMINFSIRHAASLDEQERWLDEGLAMFAEYVFSGQSGDGPQRIPPSPHFERFLEAPGVNLLSNSKESWFKEDSLYRQYGASFMFVAYMVEKYGGNSTSLQQSFLRELVRTPAAGVAGINALFSSSSISFKEIFTNFIIALHIDNAEAGNGMWGFADKKLAFGKSAEMLPLKMLRHYAGSDEGSFIGSDGQSLANSVIIEEIAGTAKVSLELKADDGITYYVAELLPDLSGSVRPLLLIDGKANYSADLSDGRRLLILPMAIAPETVIGTKFNYSFKSAASRLVMYPIPNPAFSEQFIILLKSFAGVLPQPPTLRISFNNLIDSPAFTAVDETNTLFIAHYQLPGNGRGQAFCYHNDDSCSFSFSSVKLRASAMVVAEDSGVTLAVNAPNAGMAAIACPDSMVSLPSGAVGGPFDTFFDADASATLNLADQQIKQHGVCRLDASGKLISWSSLRASEAGVSAPISAPGRYFLVKDVVPPVLKDLHIRQSAANNCILKFSLSDGLSGVNPESLQVRIGNRQLGSQRGSSWESGISLGELPAGDNSLEVEVSDYAGNVARAQIKAVVVSSADFRVAVYPNPCHKNVHLQLTFAVMPDYSHAEVKIYDVAGDLVDSLELLPVGAVALAAVWDLTGRNGKPVSNGTYFYRVSLRGSITKVKASGKIAVLR